jgi:uncharacterized membrane protein
LTLNITILTPVTIYQSADFRLTDPKTGWPITNRSAKSVVLTYSTWAGFITYTGLGSWSNSSKALSDWVAGWLDDGKERSMAEVADHLADEGTKLLTAVQRQTGRWFKHTFTLAGFEAGFVRVFTISNFENCYGEARNSPDRQLTVTTRKLGTGGKATVIVTGYKPAVSTDDRRKLRELASRYPMDGGRIRRRMEALNAKAAMPSVSKGFISQDCVVLSFRGDGSGVLQLNNAADEIPSQFPHILNGMNVAQFMNDALKNLGVDLTKARLVQGAFATSHSPGPTAVSATTCPFAVAVVDAASGYRIHEITLPDLDFITPNDINDSGQVVGTGQEQSSTRTYIPWLMQNGQLTHLNYAGYAVAINNQGQVAGTLRGEQGERAIVYEEGLLTEFPLYHGAPGVFAGTDSSARAINADGVIAGSVRSRTEERGRPNTHAAVFQPGQPPTVLMELQADFGSSAVTVNASDQVLVLASPGPSVFDVRTIMWTPQNGSWRYIGNPTANVFPIVLTDDGLVLGQVKNSRGEPIAVICRPGGDWERLGTNDAWEPIDINDQGDVIGWAWVDRLQRPWLRLASGQIIWLPYVIEHHTTPKAINNNGQIIGSAVSDHGQHAVIWQR